MTRKDTILIAVVINAGLLAILFTTAVIYDTDKGIEPVTAEAPLAEANAIPPAPPPTIAANNVSSGDEVDNVLRSYTPPSSQPLVVETQQEIYTPEPIVVQANAPEEEIESPKTVEIPKEEKIVEVVVKKGDVLEKIARANKSTIQAIKKENNLQNEKLSIGQVLRVPVSQGASVASKDKKQEQKEGPKEEKNKDSGSKEVVYYEIKSGDNPWKIAKKFNVKYADILKLNQMNEEKARNLKVGERIRVK